MQAEFLGGASRVGSLGMVLGVPGGPLLFDYGITPAKPPEYPRPSPRVSSIFLTHAHVDHSGMVPQAASDSDVLVRCTSLTGTVARMLAADTLKIARNEGYPQPYGDRELSYFEESIAPLEVGEEAQMGPTIITPHPAGHIPGAQMYLADTGGRTLLFTGDINTGPTGLVNGCRPVGCDVLVMESTYAGREHESRRKVEADFLAKVEEVVDRGGLAVVPAFAVGRTQEVMMLLERSGLDVWVDGMGKAVTDMYLNERSYLRDPDRLARSYKRCGKVRSPASRSKAARADVVVTTSGMLDGGPALEYIRQIREDPRSAILLTGYQVEGTNGRKLVETGTMDFFGVAQRVEAEVGFFDLSAHSGHSELVEFAKGCSPGKIVLCHGDNRGELADALSGEFEVLTPCEGEPLDL